MNVHDSIASALPLTLGSFRERQRVAERVVEVLGAEGHHVVRYADVRAVIAAGVSLGRGSLPETTRVYGEAA